METVGFGATVLVALVVALGVVIGVRSIPDLQRYMRIRKM